MIGQPTVNDDAASGLGTGCQWFDELTGTSYRCLDGTDGAAVWRVSPVCGSDGKMATAILPSGGGTDPWTYLKLAADFTTSSNAAVNVTGLAFTPDADATYEFYARLFCRTPVTLTVGPRPGLAWPTGMLDGIATIEMPTSATAKTVLNGNIAASMLAAVGGLPSLTQSFLATISGVMVSGLIPSGTLRVQLASETNLTNVTIKAGSFLAYRKIN